MRAGTDVGGSFFDQAFSRAAGAHRITGNRVDLLLDAAENYPAWLSAIAAASRYVNFESYILRDDAAGREFADALAAKARGGVPVRVVYDWLGALGKTPSRFWKALRHAGVEVRCFNPFRLASPLGWMHRDHRKTLTVDGCVGFVTGLCVGDDWVGDPARGIAPWRDTGVAVHGPAVAAIEQGFRDVWSRIGPPTPDDERRAAEGPRAVGDMTVRVVASEPYHAGLIRVDELVAEAARETIWLHDAYFAGTPTYIQSLRAAALDGVDVRLLVPGGTDIPILRPLSRAGYRPLLEAGVRVFEWNGPMLHAKTSVADGRWARVGSSNLNLASWLGNYEMDVIVEDERFARAMMEQYLRDLTNATEVVLRPGRRQLVGRAPLATPESAREPLRARPHARGSGSAGRAAAGAIRLGNTVTAAVTDRRVLAHADARVVVAAGAVLIAAAVAASLWPRVFAIPFAVVMAWFGGALLVRAHRLHRTVPPSGAPRTGSMSAWRGPPDEP
ncbi:MAG TPA: phosphatidylserine/phosphatidylglycerophosphate/cardiolipin synthase family protein [Gemmatimonadaceae bacterium]|nr:phosphatidylserine/phosphatidylglycerophosphate/cardiolipin synthase family protein [Gemmatimonadaceae bacterium]